jgi:hypothetical protein
VTLDFEIKRIRLDAERGAWGWRCSLQKWGQREMIDPSAQNGTINFAGRCDDWNFSYRDRDGGTMLANSLDYALCLGNFGRYSGMIVVI